MSKHSCSAVCFRMPENGNLQEIEVLLIKENHKKGDFKAKDRWELPGGKCCGSKEKGPKCCPEESDQTITREWQEEVGGSIEIVLRLEAIQKRNRETGNHFTWYVYLVRMIEPPTKIITVAGGDTSPAWFKVSALPLYLFDSHRTEIISAAAFIRSDPDIQEQIFNTPASFS